MQIASVVLLRKRQTMMKNQISIILSNINNYKFNFLKLLKCFNVDNIKSLLLKIKDDDTIKSNQIMELEIVDLMAEKSVKDNIIIKKKMLINELLCKPRETPLNSIMKNMSDNIVSNSKLEEILHVLKKEEEKFKNSSNLYLTIISSISGCHKLLSSIDDDIDIVNFNIIKHFSRSFSSPKMLSKLSPRSFFDPRLLLIQVEDKINEILKFIAFCIKPFMEKRNKENSQIKYIDEMQTPVNFSDYNIKNINLQEYKNIFNSIEESKKFQNAKNLNKPKEELRLKQIKGKEFNEEMEKVIYKLGYKDMLMAKKKKNQDKQIRLEKYLFHIKKEDLKNFRSKFNGKSIITKFKIKQIFDSNIKKLKNVYTSKISSDFEKDYNEELNFFQQQKKSPIFRIITPEISSRPPRKPLPILPINLLIKSKRQSL